jgi:hypothetical protein
MPDIYNMSRTKHQISRGTVNHQSWLQFLQAITRWEDDARLLNGELIKSQTDTRALYRWEKEGTAPVWWKVDQFLCSYNLTWTDFEIWCFVEGRNLWEKERPEHWEEMT